MIIEWTSGEYAQQQRYINGYHGITESVYISAGKSKQLPFIASDYLRVQRIKQEDEIVLCVVVSAVTAGILEE